METHNPHFGNKKFKHILWDCALKGLITGAIFGLYRFSNYVKSVLPMPSDLEQLEKIVNKNFKIFGMVTKIRVRYITSIFIRFLQIDNAYYIRFNKIVLEYAEWLKRQHK